MGQEFGSASNFRLKPEYILNLGPGLASKMTLASKKTLATKRSSIQPIVSGSFAYNPVRTPYNVADNWNSDFELLNITDEGIKQGLRDLQIFIEEEPNE